MDSILIEYNGKDYKISEPTINLWNKLNLLKDLYDSEQEYLILVISLMTGLDRENILKASWSSIQQAGEYLTDYLLKQTNDFYNEFEFAGVKYKFIDLKNITFGEFIDLDSYLQQPPARRMSELHTLMAFLYREVGSDGKIEPYDGSKVEHRAELFKFLPVKYLNGAMRFFLTLEVLLEKNTHSFSARVKRWMKLTVHKKISAVIGVGIRLFTFYLKRTSSALRRFHNSRSQSHSTTSLTPLTLINKNNENLEN